MCFSLKEWREFSKCVENVVGYACMHAYSLVLGKRKGNGKFFGGFGGR